MKLQRFIESYQRNQLETPTSLSHDRSYVFKTSESIGTLNSQDDNGTDRSFVVKEQNVNPYENCESIEHLRQLCESQQKNEKESSNFEITKDDRQCQQWIEEYQSPTFSKTQTSIHSFVKNRSKGVLQQQDGEVSFSMCPDNGNFLYEEAPSELYQGCPTEEQTCYRQEEIWFLQNYNQLLKKIIILQKQNSNLQDELQQETKIGDDLTDKEENLSWSITALKQQVSQIIQSNIELQNKIKEMLLKHEMEKYNCTSKEKNRALIKGYTSQSSHSLRKKK